jgi:hypothetical protein
VRFFLPPLAGQRLFFLTIANFPFIVYPTSPHPYKASRIDIPMAAHNSSCADSITSRGMTGSNSCRDVSISASSITSNRQASGTPASPKNSIYLDGYPSTTSVYSLTSAPTSDCESPPETPARGRSSELTPPTPTLSLLPEPLFSLEFGADSRPHSRVRLQRQV